MLTALEEGVEGGRWYSLMDKVASRRALQAAFDDVKKNKGAAGVDHRTIAMVESRLDEELGRLERELQSGEYRPKAVRRVWIPKPGSAEKRPLGIPTVQDRVVQTALRYAIEPIFEKEFAAQSYGFRPGRGCKDALRRVADLLAQGYVHVVDADLKAYFDSIPHERLLRRVEEKVTDGRVLNLVADYLKADIMDTAARWTPEQGSPQGAVISPLLSNIYLHPLDQKMAEAGYQMVRYADDFVVLCRRRDEAEKALAVVREWTEGNGLSLHPEKTHIVDATQRGGFDFLGYHFERGYRWPRKKSLTKLKDAIRAKTRRTAGTSLETIVEHVNRTTRGWFEYFKHSHETTFPRLDKWIRMRLRSILRRRHRGKGRGRGADHQRWPNAYFDVLGLFSFVTAQARLRQSLAR
jgi:RNA-directed DNA polymerase